MSQVFRRNKKNHLRLNFRFKLQKGFTQHFISAYQRCLSGKTASSPLNEKSAGFTLIELLVVLAIMGIMLGLILANIAGQRGKRNLKIAQNELVSNIRKIQSYTLSARDVRPGVSPQYYLIKFDLNKPNQYFIQAIYDVENGGKVTNIESVKLPDGVRLADYSSANCLDSAICITNRPGILPSQTPSACALLAFKAPFAKIITNDNCSPASLPADPYDITNATNDYTEIKNFTSNGGSASSDATMVIKLFELQSKTTRTISVNGLSGLITFQ